MTGAVRIGRVRFKPGAAGAVLPARAQVPGSSPGMRRVVAQGGPGAVYPWPGGLPLSSGFAYEAEDLFSEELGAWSPWLRSADTELDWYRDRRVARVRDLERNDGWARGAITRTVDDTIGSLFRLVSKPDWRALSRYAPECDETWA